MMSKLICGSVFLFVLVSQPSGADSASPYAGQETRDIKALAPEDVDAYLSGKGMGLAKAAELNGYPGPAHVLAMATELELNASQKERTEALFRNMQAKATSLGHALIAQERRLDEEFASKTITQKSLETILGRIGQLQVEVRGATRAPPSGDSSTLRMVQRTLASTAALSSATGRNVGSRLSRAGTIFSSSDAIRL
jgi:hypothetical protein